MIACSMSTCLVCLFGECCTTIMFVQDVLPVVACPCLVRPLLSCFPVLLFFFFVYDISAKSCLLLFDMKCLKIYYSEDQVVIKPPTEKVLYLSCSHVFVAIDIYNDFFQTIFQFISLLVTTFYLETCNETRPYVKIVR